MTTQQTTMRTWLKGRTTGLQLLRRRASETGTEKARRTDASGARGGGGARAVRARVRALSCVHVAYCTSLPVAVGGRQGR